MSMPSSDAQSTRQEMSSEHLYDMRDRLRKRAYLYNSPDDFRAGVEAALSTLIREKQTRDLDLGELEHELDLTTT